MNQIVDLSQHIESAHVGSAPAVVNVVVTTNAQYTTQGPVTGYKKIEPYVRLSALPEELQQRIVRAVNMLNSYG